MNRLTTMRILLLLMLMAGTEVWGQTPDLSFPQTNGRVFNVTQDANGDIYIGGDFSTVYSSKYPAVEGCIGMIGKSLGVVDTGFPKVNPNTNGSVDITVPDGLGGWYIGGNFSSVGGVSISNVAHIKSDGTVNNTWNPSPNSFVYSIVVSNTDVYIGGLFSIVGGQTHERIAKIGKNGIVNNTWNPSVNSTVHTLVLDGSNLYFGGTFTEVNGFPRGYVAKIGTDGVLDNTWIPNIGGFVYSMAIDASGIYIGGVFDNIGGTTRDHLAKYDRNGSFITTWTPVIDSAGRILEIISNGVNVYICGVFGSVSGQTRNSVAKLDAITGNLDSSWNPDIEPYTNIKAIALDGNSLYVGASIKYVALIHVII